MIETTPTPGMRAAGRRPAAKSCSRGQDQRLTAEGRRICDAGRGWGYPACTLYDIINEKQPAKAATGGALRQAVQATAAVSGSTCNAVTIWRLQNARPVTSRAYRTRLQGNPVEPSMSGPPSTARGAATGTSSTASPERTSGSGPCEEMGNARSIRKIGPIAAWRKACPNGGWPPVSDDLRLLGAMRACGTEFLLRRQMQGCADIRMNPLSVG